MKKRNEKCNRPPIPRKIADEIYRLHYDEDITVRQLSEDFDRPFKTIEGLITRENKRRKIAISGALQLGRRSKAQDEITRLKMENQLLRDFLYIAGKR